MSFDTSKNITFENDHVKFEFRNNIVIGTYKDVKITLDVAKGIVKTRLELFNGKNFPILINEVKLKQIDREARSFLSSSEASIGLTASALISKSPLTLHLANFFLKITARSSKMPARIFSDEKEAIAWLQNYTPDNANTN